MTQSQRGASEQTGPSEGQWALGFAVLLFTYAAVGGVAGVLWLIDLIDKLVAGPPPSRPYITAWSVNLLFAPIALVGGVLAVGYYSAAGWAIWPHNSDDQERASIALKRLWRWARMTVIVLSAFLVSMFVAAVMTGEFPG